MITSMITMNTYVFEHVVTRFGFGFQFSYHTRSPPVTSILICDPKSTVKFRTILRQPQQSINPQPGTLTFPPPRNSDLPTTTERNRFLHAMPQLPKSSSAWAVKSFSTADLPLAEILTNCIHSAPKKIQSCIYLGYLVGRDHEGRTNLKPCTFTPARTSADNESEFRGLLGTRANVIKFCMKLQKGNLKGHFVTKCLFALARKRWVPILLRRSEQRRLPTRLHCSRRRLQRNFHL